jgi:hypothetical protein
MVRRTITLPEPVDSLVRLHARDGESFSAAVARFVQAGIEAEGGKDRYAWIGSFDGPPDLGERVEEYLREIVMDPEFEH